eukprot:11220519-Lingulodinium_polyedra.AAC.1
MRRNAACSAAVAASWARRSAGAGPRAPPAQLAKAAAACTTAAGQRGAPLMPHRTVMAPRTKPGAHPVVRPAR